MDDCSFLLKKALLQMVYGYGKVTDIKGLKKEID
jgi:hypothetical protein